MTTMSSLEPAAVVTPIGSGPLVWLNGEIMPLDGAKAPAADHAHLYGDGLFEGIRIYHRSIFKFEEHLDRLYNGIKTLWIQNMMPKEQLRQAILDVATQAGISDGYIRLNITRGSGLGLDPWKIVQTPNVMIMVNSLKLFTPEQYETGLTGVTCSTRVFPPQCLDPRIKSIGRYVANIQAKLEANRQGAGEGIMLNIEGFIAEGTGDNIFVLSGNKLSTPLPTDGILMGITRNTVMDLARDMGLEVVEERITQHDVYTADEVFLTGTAAEIISMIELDKRTIGSGKPGPVARQIFDKYHALAKAIGTPF